MLCMAKQCLLLWKLQMRKTFGLNEIIYGRDENKKTKQALFLCLYMLAGIMLAGAGAAVSLLLCCVGASRLVPILTAALPGAVVFVFTLLRAGPVLLEKGEQELLAALPLHPFALMSARFFTLYQGAFALTLGTALPAGLIWIIMEGKGSGHLLLLLTGLPFLPLLPLTAACLPGAGIMAVSARMRHTRLIMLILTLTAAMALVCGSLFLAFRGTEPASGEMAVWLKTAVLWMERLYPPAALYAAGVTGESLPDFLCFICLSAGSFALFVRLTGKPFGRICGALQERRAHSRFRMETQKSRSLLPALCRRELRRYFASNVYVVNTLIAWLMMSAASAACMILGPEGTVALIRRGMELTAQDKAAAAPEKWVPCLLAFFGIMGNTTAVSISMEGKNLWILQTLPLSMRMLGLAKILVNLTLAIPALLLSCLFLALGGWKTGIMTVTEPLCHILFSAVFGLWMNRVLPRLDWKGEAEVVKRGGALFLTMLAGMCTVLLSLAVSFLTTTGWSILARMLLSAALLSGSAALFRDFSRRDLRGIV